MKKLWILGGMLLLLAIAACGRDHMMLDAEKASAPAGAIQPMALTAAEPGPQQEMNTESYEYLPENEFLRVSRNPLSTFSIDVDTASYANIRRFIRQGKLPPKDAVRIEEMVNYFVYDYPDPIGDYPIAISTEAAECPWTPMHRLLRIGLAAEEMPEIATKPSNLVFLLDVSGSMNDPDKLPLLKRAMKMLVQNLDEKDRVAIAVYAGASGLVLPSTTCQPENKVYILSALEELSAGGTTHGSEGIELAYDVVQKNFIPDGINRVILATDGDFNVGVTNQGDLVRLIQEKAKSNIFLTILGFGTGNLKDSTMEKLADKGNGNYGYIDTITEAKKMLVDQMGGTLVTVAKDVKIQVEFNPAQVAAYRLIGYENRLLKDQDFNDDTKDAGEMGSGHTVTALYELVPAGVEVEIPGTDPLKYQKPSDPSDAADSGELLTLKLRYKRPEADASKLLNLAVKDVGLDFENTGEDFKFAAAVAGFGMMLRDSRFKGGLTYDGIIEMARSGKGEDPYGYRAEFISLVQTAKELEQ